jgi:class 3 adenylate cyclase
MPEEQSQTGVTETRKLAAIMFTDMVGFSRRMDSDEARMLRVLEVHNQVIRHAVADFKDLAVTKRFLAALRKAGLK